ncbi:DUF4364 family protein [Agathobacter ruminis]|uniref:DUF4364 domain-containing protein n=1 Tax=Agathobacter ruminis TaxID=1712665 RepID=A0A2G3E0W5_9FIRM|nr:DUF4364 family protein [Agathobacter ruminis]MDC7301363.1 DUF4364 family protein [Agathobacter ruminis]PHU36922.1 hypothetical protein CSX02_10480 [Agathobacter ruminis]
MAKPNTIYKTIILYLLDRSECALSNLQISDFFLQEGFANYFKVQSILAELIRLGLINEQVTHENTQYTISEKGQETLSFSKDKLNHDLKNDIRLFFEQNQMSFKLENSVFSDYRRIGPESYQVDLHIQDDGRDQLALQINVHTKEQAEAICNNWKNSSDEVFALLMDTLLK